MRVYRCKCGACESFGSDSPARCVVCSKCGTTLLRDGKGGFLPEAEHRWARYYDEHTGKPYERCQGCYEKREVEDGK